MREFYHWITICKMSQPYEKQSLIPLSKSSARFMFVAPVQQARDEIPILYSPPRNILDGEGLAATKSVSQRFVSRGKQNAPFTSLMEPKPVRREKLLRLREREYRPSNGSEAKRRISFRFNVLSADVYEHFDMEVIVAFAEIDEPKFEGRDSFQYLSDLDIVSFEEATTDLLRDICHLHFADRSHFVRWVGRTLILHGSPSTGQSKDGVSPPDAWYQHQPNMSLVELDQHVKVSANWGNSVAWSPSANYRFYDLRRSAVFAQFLWSFLSDIDTRSVDMLRRAGNADTKISEQDAALDRLVELNFDLAVASMFYERLGTESSAVNRQLVTQTLEAWGYQQVMNSITSRLGRLENILNARAEVLTRRSSRIMEYVLFILSVTGLLSLILSFVGTAYSGESGEEGKPWYPESWVIDIFRTWNLDVVLLATTAVSLFLVLLVTRKRHSKQIEKR